MQRWLLDSHLTSFIDLSYFEHPTLPLPEPSPGVSLSQTAYCTLSTKLIELGISTTDERSVSYILYTFNMPVIFASLVFAISLSLLPYTEQETEAAEIERLKLDYLKRRNRKRVRIEETRPESKKTGCVEQDEVVSGPS
jgi:hypothetical protein